MRNNLARLEPPARIPGVDLARGVAVFGMFAAHLVVTTPLQWGDPGTWSGLVDGRSAILFATLAGLSLGLTADRGSTPTALRRRRLVARAGLLWGLGVVLMLTSVPVHVILPAYALLFLIGATLLTATPRPLFLVAAALATVMPFAVAAINHVWSGSGPEQPDKIALLIGWHYPFPLWVAFLLIGLGTGKLLATGIRTAWWVLAGGITLAVLGYGVLGPIGDRAAEREENTDAADLQLWLLSRLQDGPHSSGVGEAVGSGGFALAALAVCVLISTTGVRHILWPVRAVGSMPLTAYTAHLGVWAVWILTEDRTVVGTEAMNGFLALDPFWPMVTGVTVACSCWAVVVGKGPVEWLIQRISVAVFPSSDHPTSGEAEVQYGSQSSTSAEVTPTREPCSSGTV
ncbi:heparan-alpha-glucosaminide N-acetyltransferase domain-containing protein [Corynebacterium glyciniphilum]|uniref:heparan-alpha-glucosaminide N-acetyltransferase domain-containing protein n=1 Tax=Corynebacterium glyciniphilum TaxID=1404244 RepID=UPI003DA0B081